MSESISMPSSNAGPLFMCGNKILDLRQPQVMGILNITPNSFSSVGRCMTRDDALYLAEKMVEDGATIIDVGGEATNPGVHPVVDLQEELNRVVPVVEAIAQRLDVVISVDSGKPTVIRDIAAAGAHLINDQRALRIDGALEAAQKTGLPVCLMHMLYPDGIPETPIEQPYPQGVVANIKTFLSERVQACMDAGISAERIIVDPGVGAGSFGKTAQQDLLLLRELAQFKSLGLPILVGASRKVFIAHVLGLPEEQRLPASLSAAIMAYLNGANIIRVHDVKATVEALKLLLAIQQAE